MSVHFQYLDIVERFDPEKNAWENLPSLLTVRSFASGTAVKGKVFVFGGLRPFSPDGDPCEVYDPETNMWSGIPGNVAPRSYASAANFMNGQIFVNGILGNELRGRRRVLQLYDVEKDEWKPIPEYVLHFDWHEIIPLQISRDVLANCKEISDRHVMRLRHMRGVR
ncbi:PREDICTED: influenza virus NS1A-binding protein homolog B-like [Acropora digitifera]|uniref:influenza virus NS1A-binding protein homolog B-like n=1 Tax=Acropora digitifera TaxID=70779 RepID=UPI00077A230C|nr:PREDICTED: influenza virus NS1A-binding protein homolog B-like [Acropora digitifera]